MTLKKTLPALCPLFILFFLYDTACAELIDTSTKRVTITQSTKNEVHKQTWLDEQHAHTKTWIHQTIQEMDGWFGKHPKKSATATLRVMVDVYDDKYNGTRIKPKIRGKLRLPALEHRLSMVIGDDRLDDYDNTGWHVATNKPPNSPDELSPPKELLDKAQVRTDNASFAFRFSRWKEQQGIRTDADLGVRSGGEIYGRLRAEKKWQKDTTTAHLENIYRYGTKSAHFWRSNYTLTKTLSSTRDLINHSYLEYTHNDDKKVIIGNTFYQRHQYPTRLGGRTLSYGVNASQRLDTSNWSSYGAFVNYKEPILRPWLFVEGELTYYNYTFKNQNHHLATFVRLGAEF